MLLINVLRGPVVPISRNPDEATFRDGSFDRWDVNKAFSVGWRMHHAYALSKNVENPVV